MSHIQNTESKLIKKFHDEWCVENGYKPQAPSIKPEELHAMNTLSFKLQAEKKNPKVQAPSISQIYSKYATRRLRLVTGYQQEKQNF